MKYYPKNTLAYYNAAPQFKRFDLRDMPVEVFAASTKIYRKDCGLTNPDPDALNFYALNHCASILRKTYTPNTVLPEWAKTIMEEYVKLVASQGNRMLHYILSICPREMRHLSCSGQSSEFFPTLQEKYGEVMIKALHSMVSFNEDAVVVWYMDHPPAMKIGEYIAGLAHGFDHGIWPSSYGGKKWGNVAHAAESFFLGKFSMEMLVDTGYTLAHNGGPIYNKGMMYNHYTDSFITILDIQRSGQVPELVLDKTNWGIFIPSTAKVAVTMMQDYMPGVFGSWVDWDAVMKLGAAKSYVNNSTKQKKMHPIPVAPKNPVIKVVSGKNMKEIGTYSVYPGQIVKVYQRVSV